MVSVVRLGADIDELSAFARAMKYLPPSSAASRLDLEPKRPL
jgi:hypothetical protein